MENEEQVFGIADISKLKERILVIGVGGGGGNALNHIIQSGVEGVEYVAANTDARALIGNKASIKIVLGEKSTKGLGAGGIPNVGTDAAKESIEIIKDIINGESTKKADMVFITAGMGGGTGTGASPIIAEAAREAGALVVGVVTTPFGFEMETRFKIAEGGVKELEEKVDALLVIENQRLFSTVDKKTKVLEAYRFADEVLRQAVQGVTDLILKPGLINLDFRDVYTVLSKAGTAIMGVGHGEGDDAAETAARSALKSPLMSVSIEGAKRVLFNVTAGSDMTMEDLDTISKIIRETADKDAMVMYGHTLDEDIGNKFRVTVIAAGFQRESQKRAMDLPKPQIPQMTQQMMPMMEPNRPAYSGRIRGLKTSHEASIDDSAFQQEQSQASEDMFSSLPGLPRDQYDTPTVLRRQQRR